MFKIKTLNKISDIGLEILCKDKYEVSDTCENPDGIILRSANMHDMEINAKAVARAGAGVNNIPIEKCTEKGIVVFNTPGANANAVKELTIAALFLASRKITDGINWAKTLISEGDEVPKLVEKGKTQFAGPEILGKKLGIIGLGAIGVMVANTAHSLSMDVIGFDPYISVDAAWGLSRAVRKADNINQIFSECDYISIHVPLNKQTKGMINSDAFSAMKKGVKILNFSRAELVDNDALKNAVDENIVSCYITDFPTKETLSIKNVISIPHLGASTPESEDNCAIMAAKQMKDFLETGTIVNSVNFPSCSMAPEGKGRITVTHKNVKSMVGQFSTILAENNINILNMTNRSKDSIAYNIVDTETEVPQEVIDRLVKIKDIVDARKIW